MQLTPRRVLIRHDGEIDHAVGEHLGQFAVLSELLHPDRRLQVEAAGDRGHAARDPVIRLWVMGDMREHLCRLLAPADEEDAPLQERGHGRDPEELVENPAPPEQHADRAHERVAKKDAADDGQRVQLETQPEIRAEPQRATRNRHGVELAQPLRPACAVEIRIKKDDQQRDRQENDVSAVVHEIHLRSRVAERAHRGVEPQPEREQQPPDDGEDIARKTDSHHPGGKTAAAFLHVLFSSPAVESRSRQERRACFVVHKYPFQNDCWLETLRLTPHRLRLRAFGLMVFLAVIVIGRL